MQITKELVKQFIQCDQSLHNWARLIGQIGYKLVSPQSDDSHANFQWNSKNSTLEGRSFRNDSGTFHAFFQVDDNTFGIESNGETIKKIATTGVSADTVILEIHQTLNDLGFQNVDLTEGLSYRFPDRFDHENMALPIATDGLKLWKIIRTGANVLLGNLLETFNQSSEIRIWPSNFDTGIFCEYDNDFQQFAGFAQADEKVVDVPYFYNSFYKDNKSIVPTGFPDLKNGYWETMKWAGAVLPMTAYDTSEAFLTAAETFLVESTRHFLTE